MNLQLTFFFPFPISLFLYFKGLICINYNYCVSLNKNWLDLTWPEAIVQTLRGQNWQRDPLALKGLRLWDGTPTTNDLHTRDRLDLRTVINREKRWIVRLENSEFGDISLTCLSWRILEGFIMFTDLKLYCWSLIVGMPLWKRGALNMAWNLRRTLIWVFLFFYKSMDLVIIL